MNIIPFPGAQRRKRQGLVIEVFDDECQKLVINHFEISCPKCQHKNSFDTESAIFKTVDFFCGGCGQSIKVTNPGLKSKFIPRR